MQESLPQLQPIPSFVCNTERLPQGPRVPCSICVAPGFTQGWSRPTMCTHSQKERGPQRSCMWPLGGLMEDKEAGHRHQGRLPSRHQPVPASVSLPALLSHTTERLRRGFPLPLPSGIEFSDFTFYPYQVSLEVSGHQASYEDSNSVLAAKPPPYHTLHGALPILTTSLGHRGAGA